MQTSSQQKPYFYVKKLDEKAHIPKKGSEKAAGYDLHALGDTVVLAQGKQLVKTGLSFAIPAGNYARLAPRSGLAWKNFIDVGAGVIDEDYRGEVCVVLFNHSKEDFQIKAGDRIAQVIIEKITDTEILEVQDLNDTARGGGGFGSTGVQAQDEGKASKRKEEVQAEQVQDSSISKEFLAQQNGNQLNGMQTE